MGKSCFTITRVRILTKTQCFPAKLSKFQMQRRNKWPFEDKSVEITRSDEGLKKKKKNSVKGKARKENKPQSMIKHVIHTDRVPWTRWCLLSNSARVGYNVIWKRVNSWCMDCSWIKQQKQAVRISNITPPQKKTVWNSEYLSH